MAELYYTYNPDMASPIGLMEVPIVGLEDVDHQHAYEGLIGRIREAGQASRSDSLMFESISSGKGIPREFVPNVLAAVYMTAEPFEVDFLTLDGLATAADKDPGLTAALLGSVHEDLADFMLDEVAEAFAAQIESEEERWAEEEGRAPRAVMFGFQRELVWREDEASPPQPVLLSNREHLVLGYLATNGTFERAVTILSQDHPVHQPPEG
jgi:hypothetical protein